MSRHEADLDIDGDLRLRRRLQDSAGTAGTAGQVLAATATGVGWAAAGEAAGAVAAHAATLHLPAVTNAGEVLTVNAAGTGVEWVAQPVTRYHVNQAITANIPATITHNLNEKFVCVHVYDATGQEVGAVVNLVDANSCTVTVSVAGTYDITVRG